MLTEAEKQDRALALGEARNREVAESRLHLASRIERAGGVALGIAERTKDDGGYLSIIRAFSPQERALIIAALRSQ